MSGTKELLFGTLSDLTEDQLKQFKSKLCDCELKPRIRRGEVEKADRLDLVDILISRHTTNKAVPVTIRILESMNCNDLATELNEIQGELGSARGEGASSGGAANPAAAEKHFVDVHRTALIERVTNTRAILDRLLEREVITQSGYEEVMAERTNQNRMRKIFSGPMHSGGKRAKDALCEILESQERFLMNELKQLRG
ncbi:hypothetical protein ANANG_G00002350 [Anguilla anguilla]|uniref:CARD domain-containing protein n=1 Tax=Anguilla anguilla TaxID=7936 RepID=A0A9D3S5W4_ANGAN|nr:hypothetical protein ANANG_G00002350 [Anguilla anguilla]